MWRDLLKTSFLSSGLLALTITGCVNANDIELPISNTTKVEDTSFFEYQEAYDSSFSSYEGNIGAAVIIAGIPSYLFMTNGIVYTTNDYKTFTINNTFREKTSSVDYGSIRSGAKIGKTFFIITSWSIYSTTDFTTYEEVLNLGSSYNYITKCNLTDCYRITFYDKTNKNVTNVILTETSISRTEESVDYQPPSNIYSINGYYLTFNNTDRKKSILGNKDGVVKEFTNSSNLTYNLLICGVIDNQFILKYTPTDGSAYMNFCSISLEKLLNLTDDTLSSDDTTLIASFSSSSEKVVGPAAYIIENFGFFVVYDNEIYKINENGTGVSLIFEVNGSSRLFAGGTSLYVYDYENFILYKTQNLTDWEQIAIPIDSTLKSSYSQTTYEALKTNTGIHSVCFYDKITKSVVIEAFYKIPDTSYYRIQFKVLSPLSVLSSLSSLNSTVSSHTSTLSSHTSSISSLSSRPYITASKLAQTGYVKWSNGLLIQWGLKSWGNSTSSYKYSTITMPLAYKSSSAYQVILTGYPAGSGSDYCCGLDNSSSNGTTWTAQKFGFLGIYCSTPRYIAIGYV